MVSEAVVLRLGFIGVFDLMFCVGLFIGCNSKLLWFLAVSSFC